MLLPCCSRVAPVLLPCCSRVARCCSRVAPVLLPMSFPCRSRVAPVLLPVLLPCCSRVAPVLLPCCSRVAPVLLPCCSRVAPVLLPCCSRPSRFLFRVLQWSLVTICYVLNVFVSFLGFRCSFLVFYCFCDFPNEDGDKATNLAAKPCFLHSELALKPMVRVLAAWRLSF